MAEIRNAQLLGWVVDTLESTSYKTTHELIQTLANKPGGQVFNEITARINQYENNFLSKQREHAHSTIIECVKKFNTDETQQPQFKQSLINNIIYLIEKTNFDEFFSHAGNKEYFGELLSC